MKKETRTARTVRDWVIATRPWSFPASVMPILIMWGILYSGRSAAGLSVDWTNALLCLPLLVLLHAGGNMVSDYFDYTRRVDLPDCPNGVTWLYDGLFRPVEILRYGVVLVLAGALLGVWLLCRSSWTAVWIGAAGLALVFGYFWMKGHLLGDLNILLSFALLPAVGTMFVSTGSYHLDVLLYILPLGLLTVSILHANNTRDILSDKRAGLRTLPDRLGGRFGKWAYVAEVVLPYLLTPVYVLFFGQPWPLLIVFLTLPLAVRNVRTMLSADDGMVGQIPTLDKASAQLQMLFGLLYASGYFISACL